MTHKVGTIVKCISTYFTKDGVCRGDICRVDKIVNNQYRLYNLTKEKPINRENNHLWGLMAINFTILSQEPSVDVIDQLIIDYNKGRDAESEIIRSYQNKFRFVKSLKPFPQSSYITSEHLELIPLQNKSANFYMRGQKPKIIGDMVKIGCKEFNKQLLSNTLYALLNNHISKSSKHDYSIIAFKDFVRYAGNNVSWEVVKKLHDFIKEN